MSNKFKDIGKKQHTKVTRKYSYLLHWICDDQRFEIRKN